MKTNWKEKNKTKAGKLLLKTRDEFRSLQDTLFQLSYLANGNNDPILVRKIQDLQAIVREALEIIRH